MSVVSIREVDGQLAARWNLGFEDLALLNAKPVTTRLGFAAQLMMYRTAGRRHCAEILAYLGSSCQVPG